ncbi:hypothetical protein CDL12_02971 [Handroanthus impetiginosus]|uniref:Uncharacterized protein n=1 Tax=Handroanthus impetiginosus TaxID=429701 RepID=A0A2G9I3G6_9LAMI|nr:hypothetical protein CDL12_02971 [Handroanthus impetiginosus]
MNCAFNKEVWGISSVKKELLRIDYPSNAEWLFWIHKRMELNKFAFFLVVLHATWLRHNEWVFFALGPSTRRTKVNFDSGFLAEGNEYQVAMVARDSICCCIWCNTKINLRTVEFEAFLNLLS